VNEATRIFQVGHADHLGNALVTDGVDGPLTQWSRAFETLCQARREIIKEARAHLGLVEDPPGSNGDPDGVIQTWLSRCDAKPGDPWCAAFASWCLGRGVPVPVRIAGAQALGKRFPATSNPVTGDLFWFPTQGEHGHVGLVLGVSPTEIMTIEGNCGNAVRCVRRDRADLRFSRTVPDTTGTCPGVLPSVPPPPKGIR
jgi:hypothetical protein